MRHVHIHGEDAHVGKHMKEKHNVDCITILLLAVASNYAWATKSSKFLKPALSQNEHTHLQLTYLQAILLNI